MRLFVPYTKYLVAATLRNSDYHHRNGQGVGFQREVAATKHLVRRYRQSYWITMKT